MEGRIKVRLEDFVRDAEKGIRECRFSVVLLVGENKIGDYNKLKEMLQERNIPFEERKNLGETDGGYYRLFVDRAELIE